MRRTLLDIAESPQLFDHLRIDVRRTLGRDVCGLGFQPPVEKVAETAGLEGLASRHIEALSRVRRQVEEPLAILIEGADVVPGADLDGGLDVPVPTCLGCAGDRDVREDRLAPIRALLVTARAIRNRRSRIAIWSWVTSTRAAFSAAR